MVCNYECFIFPPFLQGLGDQVRCQDYTRIDSSHSHDHMAAEQDSDCGVLSDMVQKS